MDLANNDRSVGTHSLSVSQRSKWLALAEIAALATCLLALDGAADAARKPAEKSHIALDAYARPGERVLLPNGARLNLRCTGKGSPTIILTAGAGEQSLTWADLQSQLSAKTRVCSWDRPGFGFSDASGEPLTTTHLTDGLEAALKSARISQPYLLVGHSLGSFETLMLAFRHPERVAGIVLIDPAGPFQDARLRRAAPATYAVIDSFQTAQVRELERCIQQMQVRTKEVPPADTTAKCVMAPDKQYPASLNRALIKLDSNVAGKKAYLSLLNSMFSDADSRELMRAWHPLGNIPITVLTAGEPPAIPATGDANAQIPALQAAWSSMHDEMAQLSTRGINRTVSHATHYIYKDQPDTVLSAVDEFLRTYRR